MKFNQMEVVTLKNAIQEYRAKLLDLDTIPGKRKPVRSDSPELLRVLKLKESFENFRTSPSTKYSLSVYNKD